MGFSDEMITECEHFYDQLRHFLLLYFGFPGEIPVQLDRFAHSHYSLHTQFSFGHYKYEQANHFCVNAAFRQKAQRHIIKTHRKSKTNKKRCREDQWQDGKGKTIEEAYTWWKDYSIWLKICFNMQ